MTATLAHLGKGHRFEPARLVLTPDWVQAYVTAVEDGAIAAFPGIVPPMGLAALAIRTLLERAALPDGAVHLGQELSFRRAVECTEDLEVNAAIVNRSDRAGWAILAVETELADPSGGAVLESRSTLTFPVTGGNVDLDAAAAEAADPAGPPLLTKRLTQEKIDVYAVAGGDHNPLHVDPDFASRTRFGGTIAHGMLVLAYLSETMTLTCGEKWLARGRLKVRFRAPARPGDTVQTFAVARDGSWEIEARNQERRVLTSGQAGITTPDMDECLP